VVEMSSLFFGETGELCPHSAACTPTHPQIALKVRIAEIILQVPYTMATHAISLTDVEKVTLSEALHRSMGKIGPTQ
jgi:hypothetical protein